LNSNPAVDSGIEANRGRPLSQYESELLYWRRNRYFKFMLRPTPVPPVPYFRPAQGDVGQIGENEAVTWGDWRAIFRTHADMSGSLLRHSRPAKFFGPGFKEVAPKRTARQLQPINWKSQFNRESRDEAMDVIRPADLLSEGAVFRGMDAVHVVLTKRHDGTYCLFYFDRGVRMPWKAATYDTLEHAVEAVTGRQFYLFGWR